MTLTNPVDVDDVLTANYLLKSEGDLKTMPDISYFERNLIRNIPEESRETFVRGRNITVQDVPENTDYDIIEWKFIKKFFKLKIILIEQVVRLDEKKAHSGHRLVKITFTSFHLAADTLEVCRANRYRLPAGIHMHLDRPNDARVKRKSEL